MRDAGEMAERRGLSRKHRRLRKQNTFTRMRYDIPPYNLHHKQGIRVGRGGGVSSRSTGSTYSTYFYILVTIFLLKVWFFPIFEVFHIFFIFSGFLLFSFFYDKSSSRRWRQCWCTAGPWRELRSPSPRAIPASVFQPQRSNLSISHAEVVLFG